MMMNGMGNEPMEAMAGDGSDMVEAFRGGAARLSPEEQQILRDAISPAVAAALTKMFGPAFGAYLEPFLADDEGGLPDGDPDDGMDAVPGMGSGQAVPPRSPIGRSGEMADGMLPSGPGQMPPGAPMPAPGPRPFPPDPRRPVSGLGGAGMTRR